MYGGFYRGYWGYPSVYGPTYYQAPVEHDPTLGIDYTNVTNVVMKQIEFGLIVKGVLVAEVKDVGTFSPGAEIKHKFGLNPNVFPTPNELREVRSAEDHVRRRKPLEESAPAAYKDTMYGRPHE